MYLKNEAKNLSMLQYFNVKIQHVHCITFEMYRNNEKGVSVAHNPITPIQPLLTF